MKLTIDGKKGVIEEEGVCDLIPAFADSVLRTTRFTVTPDKVLEAAQYVIDHLIKEASSDAVEA